MVAVARGRAAVSRLALLGVPSSAGAYAPGQEQAPRALREAGLVAALEERGVAVEDLGDLAVRRWEPDRENRFAQNVATVADVVREAAERIGEVLAPAAAPAAAAPPDAAPPPVLVLGGDCTVALAGVSALRGLDGSLGLVYLDMHSDLNTPASVRDGALDWMGVAHLLALPDTRAELTTELGPRSPLLEPADVLFVAHQADQATPHELATIDRLGIATVPADAVDADPLAAAADAVRFAARFDRVHLHFDVDAIDFTDAPLSENTGRNIGVSFAAAFATLGRVVREARPAVVSIGELNPLHGAEDGSTLGRFVDALAGALA